MSVSILMLKAFSMRNAMVPDKSERPLRNVDSAGRETPSTGRSGGDGQVERFDNLGLDELTGMWGVQHAHGRSPR